MGAGLLIALEGPEGAGKTTQSRMLGDRLRQAGHRVVVSREPGGTALGRELRRLVLEPTGCAMLPETEALLYAADRAEHVGRLLRPALDEGAIVVCDRFVDSSIAYQGAGRGLDGTDFRAMQRFASHGLEPDLRLLLDLPVDVGLARRFAAAGSPNRLDGAGLAFHERVRAAYRAAAAAAPWAWGMVDAAAAPDAVARAIEAIVWGRLGSRLAGGPPRPSSSATGDRVP